ncbi:MAG TPA: mechanosensitive ion channel protein MscS [Clostridiales bacterium]|nr:mechanosensitive ion channel protein MscS [Clostridiales bacterium]
MDWQQVWQTVQNWLTNTGIKIVIAIAIMIVSFSLINWICKKIAKRADKKVAQNKKIDKTIYKTVSYVVKVALKVLVVIALIGYVGIDTSAITALIASLGVGVGLAINGTLSNFAGGVLILITRPFKDDDYIQACGYEGTVEDIRICHTRLRTLDNKVVYLPNGNLSTSQIVNFSEKDLRRVDLKFSISYSDDFEKAKAVIADVCAQNELILKDPEPSIRVSEQSASSIDISTKVWCKNADYWTVNFDMLENVKKAFDQNGITIPFNQLDVHVVTDTKRDDAVA